MNTFEYIHITIENRIGTITLNRPEKRNALSHTLVTELKTAVNQLENSNDVKVIVINARGTAFCAGADLGDLEKLQNFSYEQNLADSGNLAELFYKIYTSKKVFIAEVQGHALAGGCGLATICDFVFAVPDAKFGFPEVKIGFIPAIVMVFLLRKIDGGKTRELLLSGDPINATQAHDLGLVTNIVSSDNLATECQKFARHLVVSNSAHATMVTKEMMARMEGEHLKETLSYAVEMNAKARESEDFKRGISAFLNKEKLRW